MRMVRECYENGKRLVRKWSDHGIRNVWKSHEKDMTMVGEWLEIGTRMV